MKEKLFCLLAVLSVLALTACDVGIIGGADGLTEVYGVTVPTAEPSQPPEKVTLRHVLHTVVGPVLGDGREVLVGGVILRACGGAGVLGDGGRDSTQGGNHEREIVLPFGSIIPAHPDRL